MSFRDLVNGNSEDTLDEARNDKPILLKKKMGSAGYALIKNFNSDNTFDVVFTVDKSGKIADSANPAISIKDFAKLI